MVVPRLIERKRDGGVLTGDEWRELIAHYATDQVPDYQMAAFLMAVYFKGLNTKETAILTDEMMRSGDLIIFDEPTTALDVTTQIEVLAAIKEAIVDTGVAALYITHDLAVVAQVADHILVLRGGKMVEYGTTDHMPTVRKQISGKHFN